MYIFREGLFMFNDQKKKTKKKSEEKISDKRIGNRGLWEIDKHTYIVVYFVQMYYSEIPISTYTVRPILRYNKYLVVAIIIVRELSKFVT